MKMENYKITERFEYDYMKKKGFEPLLFIKGFELDINLRISIQRELFGHCALGRGNVPAVNQRFYRWIWDHKSHYCEECMKPLKNYSSVYCSHILTRGAFPEMAHDPRNVNLLCYKHHEDWENEKSKGMRIYQKNKKTIELLKKEYNEI